MKRRQLIFLIALTVFLTSLFLLLTGSRLLTMPLYEGSDFPLGSLITWLGLMSLPVLVHSGVSKLNAPRTRRQRYFSTIIRIVLFLAFLWLPICYLLAGNPGFNFSEKPGFQGGQTAMRIFWYYTIGLPATTVFCFLGWLISDAFSKE